MGLAQLGQESRARDLINAFTTAADKFPTFTSDGDTFKVTSMSAGRLGDQASAYKLTTKTQGLDVTVNLVLARTGEGVVTALSASAGLTDSTISDLTRLASQTLERYRSAAF